MKLKTGNFITFFALSLVFTTGVLGAPTLPDGKEAPETDKKEEKADKDAPALVKKKDRTGWDWVVHELDPRAGFYYNPGSATGDLGQFTKASWGTFQLFLAAQIPMDAIGLKMVRRLGFTMDGTMSYGYSHFGADGEFSDFGTGNISTMPFLIGTEVSYPIRLSKIGTIRPFSLIDFGFSVSSMTFEPAPDSEVAADSWSSLDFSGGFGLGVGFVSQYAKMVEGLFQVKYQFMAELASGHFFHFGLGAAYRFDWQ